MTLAQKLSLIILLKVIFIFSIKFAYFNDPVDINRNDEKNINEHLYNIHNP